MSLFGEMRTLKAEQFSISTTDNRKTIIVNKMTPNVGGRQHLLDDETGCQPTQRDRTHSKAGSMSQSEPL